MNREYSKSIIRVRRNTGPVGGPWVCEEGWWEQDSLRQKRDRFHVERTLKIGTKAECEEARAAHPACSESGAR